jgi:hypothetical protein
MYGRVEVNIHVFLTLKICRDDGSALCTGCFYQWGWAREFQELASGFRKGEKFLPLSLLDNSPAIQPIAWSLYELSYPRALSYSHLSTILKWGLKQFNQPASQPVSQSVSVLAHESNSSCSDSLNDYVCLLCSPHVGCQLPNICKASPGWIRGGETAQLQKRYILACPCFSRMFDREGSSDHKLLSPKLFR